MATSTLKGMGMPTSSGGWHPPAYAKETGMATSSLKDVGMPTSSGGWHPPPYQKEKGMAVSILDEMAIIMRYIYIYDYTLGQEKDGTPIHILNRRQGHLHFKGHGDAHLLLR